MTTQTETYEFYRAGYRAEDCNVAVGKILSGRKGYLIVIAVDDPIDTDEGQKPWSQRYVCRRCTAAERDGARVAARKAELERQLRTLSGPIDDERDRERIERDREKVSAELAAMA